MTIRNRKDHIPVPGDPVDGNVVFLYECITNYIIFCIVPFSQLELVLLVTPSFAPSCSCVILFSFRRVAMNFPILI